LIAAGGAEVLRDDSTRVANVAREAGVDVVEVIYPGQYHDFPLFEPTSDDGAGAIADIARYLEQRLPARTTSAAGPRLRCGPEAGRDGPW
jgi:acetyl esterase/lipase